MVAAWGIAIANTLIDFLDPNELVNERMARVASNIRRPWLKHFPEALLRHGQRMEKNPFYGRSTEEIAYLSGKYADEDAIDAWNAGPVSPSYDGECRCQRCEMCGFIYCGHESPMCPLCEESDNDG